MSRQPEDGGRLLRRHGGRRDRAKVPPALLAHAEGAGGQPVPIDATAPAGWDADTATRRWTLRLPWHRAGARLRFVAGLLAGLASVAAVAQADEGMARRARACTGCHGDQGRAAADGYYPRIAGKPAAYLHEQLLAFRDGRRRYALMARLLEPLSDAYLLELAQHFAALNPPHAEPVPAALDADASERARQLVTQGDGARRLPACMACHGARLTGVLPGVPALLGLPRDYLNAQLGAWRSGARQSRSPDCMAEVARRLAPADIAALSAWLAAQPLPADARPAHAVPSPLPLRCGEGTVAARGSP